MCEDFSNLMMSMSSSWILENRRWIVRSVLFRMKEYRGLRGHPLLYSLSKNFNLCFPEVDRSSNLILQISFFLD
mgnify:CR=1 FL=1